jgi:hypothetical protein
VRSMSRLDAVTAWELLRATEYHRTRAGGTLGTMLQCSSSHCDDGEAQIPVDEDQHR